VKTKLFKTSKLKVTVNKRQLMREIMLSKRPSMTTQVTEGFQPIIDNAQEKLIEDFEDHKVTKELAAGPKAENSSGLLGGYGNLFSFLGFYNSDKPLEPIRKILKRKIDVTAVRRGDQGKFVIYLTVPSKEEILAATEFKWLTGRSWVDGVEQGVSGFGRYMYDPEGFKGDNLRSKTGIQYKGGKSYGGRFENTKYISEILNNFRKNLR
jgi:hypothetical protein